MGSGSASQSAALPFRFDQKGELEILLVTTRKSKRWAIPKGNVKAGMLPHISAAREAYEEAGIVGRIGNEPCGVYYHSKVSATGSTESIAIRTFPMRVTSEMQIWPEMTERERAWLPAREALDRIGHEALRDVLVAFIAAVEAGGDMIDDGR